MLRNRSASSKKVGSRTIPSGRSVKFPGIVQDAFLLGTDRVSLYLALTGKRSSKKYTGLAADYRKLKAEQVVKEAN
jgi:hypothetical protein